MSRDFIYKARGVSDLKCHLVLTTKYRRKVLTDAMLTRLEQVFTALMEKWQGKLIEFNGECDHVHLLLQYTPQTEPSKLINNRGRRGHGGRRRFAPVSCPFRLVARPDLSEI
jgi:putative transposase